MPDAFDWNEGLYIQFPFDGGTKDGLAPFEHTDDGFMPSEMIWEEMGLMVWDAYTDTTYGQDGYSDYFLLQGAIEP